jgi:predicted O-methyltransferase YrrM
MTAHDSQRTELSSAISGIDGWLRLDEAWMLYEYARSLPRRRAVTVVEIGSWKGRSTVALALGVRAGGSGLVFAVDPHAGGWEHLEVRRETDTYSAFLNNIRVAGVDRIVKPLRMTSSSARNHFANNSVDMLFVDGSHKYEDVLRDIEDWRSALREGAVVAFNDPLSPGVYRALVDRVLKAESKFRIRRHVGNTLFFQFQRNGSWTWRDGLVLAKLRILLAVWRRVTRLHWLMPVWAIRVGRGAYERLARN